MINAKNVAPIAKENVPAGLATVEEMVGAVVRDILIFLYTP
jgi:hypothetical protein